MELYCRNCPDCEKELTYKHEKSRNNAEKKGSVCNTCCRLGEKHHNWKSYNGEYHCPECGSEMKYTLRGNLTRAQHEKSICKSCNAKHRVEKIGYPKSFLNSKRMLGKTHSQETRDKMSEAWKRRQPLSDEGRMNMRMGKIRYLTECVGNGGQFSPTYNRDSIPIIEAYGKKHGYNFQHAENGGEVRVIGYFVDGYDKDKNVVIEYYEKFHQRIKERDDYRQKQIIDHLGCEFIIIKED